MTVGESEPKHNLTISFIFCMAVQYNFKVK